MLITLFRVIMLSLLVTLSVQAQSVTISVPSDVNGLVNQYISRNASVEFVSGYRLQIISSDDRRQVDDMRFQFDAAFPEYKSLWKFSNPYYKVLAAAFYTKLEAEAARHKVSSRFRNVLVIMDNRIPIADLAPY